MSYDEERFVETWKAVIDFSKVIIGLSTSVLTVILGLIVVGQLALVCKVCLTITLLILSVLFSLYSFGRGIKALSSGQKQVTAVFFSNAAALVLIASVAILAFSQQKKEMSLDDVLSYVASSAKSLTIPIKPEQCRSIKRVADDYELTYYGTNGEMVFLIFSLKDREIKEIRKIGIQR